CMLVSVLLLRQLLFYNTEVLKDALEIIYWLCSLGGLASERDSASGWLDCDGAVLIRHERYWRRRPHPLLRLCKGCQREAGLRRDYLARRRGISQFCLRHG